MEMARQERRNRVMVGNLPSDFLRFQTAASTQLPATTVLTHYLCGTLSVTIVEAEFIKNYGLTKMDPYVRTRIGHNLYETPSDIRGGKHPLWNRTFHAYLPQGIRTLFFDILDEKAFVPDERFAWGSLAIPDSLLRGEYLDTWIDLSGKQGDNKEGKLHLICNFSPTSSQPMNVAYPTAPVMFMSPPPFYGGMPVYTAAGGVPGMPFPNHPPQVCQQAQPSAADIQQLQEMFPSYDKEVIISVLMNSGQNKEQAITTLLTMNN